MSSRGAHPQLSVFFGGPIIILICVWLFRLTARIAGCFSPTRLRQCGIGSSYGDAGWKIKLAPERILESSGADAQSRLLQVQFQNIKSNDLAQFKDISTQIVVWPAEYESGNLIYPYEKAK